MNVFNKIAIAIVSIGLLFSCETVELDLTDSPNSLAPEQADAGFFLNAIQEDFARFVQGLGQTAGQVTRLEYMIGRNYDQVYAPTAFDGTWRSAYSTILTDLYTMYPLAEEAQLRRHVGMGQVMEAFIMITLVDMFGEVPYSEAIQGADNLNPAADTGESIYDAALDLLNQAVANFQANDNAANPEFDLYYDGDWNNWIKAANSIMIKIYAQRRLVDATAASSIEAIVADPDNYISDSSEDFQFRWGTNLANPDTRHPRYGGNYINTGAANYSSNWLMGYMLSDKIGNDNETFEAADPRIRFYFYRQADCTPGNGCDTNQQELGCSVEPTPPHYVAGGFSFCNLPDGYWGRDHGDDDGIPPDNLRRTVWGVYPIGGRFDDSTFEPVDQDQGGGGAGITPIILSSTIDFLLAELDYMNGDYPSALAHMRTGMEKSFTKVRSFGDLDSSADLTFAPDTEDDTAYMNEVEELFNDADPTEKLNIMAKEFWVTLYGNGIDAYNFYRRVGAPYDLQPNVEPDPGTFIRSFFYPAVYANTNANVTQKADTSVQVFWDTNPASPTFPQAN